MSKDVFEGLYDLTAQERQELTERSLSTFVPKIGVNHIGVATGKAADIVETRFREGREQRTGFAVFVADSVAVQRAVMDRFILVDPPEHDDLYRHLRLTAHDVIPIHPHTWDQEKGPNKYVNDAIARGVVTAMTGAPSGSISTHMLARIDGLVLNEAELNQNVPGAVLIGEKVFSVAGLLPENNREIAELIGLHCLLRVQGQA